MDKDNERILLANVIGECIKSLQLDKNINKTLKAFCPTAVERLYFSNIVKEFSHYS
ncbi:hypothetical protein [Phascolarctobacterium succinatutens]|uniref:hypothetical protein n=1 Tax=Phascolarctobacterium succinatutens TaxID=626940 RepID=UPI003AB1B241